MRYYFEVPSLKVIVIGFVGVFSVGLLGMLVWGSGIAGEHKSAPVITFEKSDLIDELFCPKEFRAKITDKWKRESQNKLPELISAWTKDGATLLETTSFLTGRPFPFSARKVRVFLCPRYGGWGFPTVVVISPYILSANPEPWSDRHFVDDTFHELLHHYVFHALGYRLKSRLLTKYRSERLTVRSHLHLYAIQKAVYSRIGWQDLWGEITDRRRVFATDYLRAIDIVEKEGFQSFVDELKSN